MSELSGLAVVDKAAGWTSHDVVAKARGLLGTKKIGHSGTLDPDATGVLLLGIGKVTRLLKYLGYPEKRYTGVVVLGTATSTLDASGEVTGRWDMGGVEVEQLREAAEQLTGDILQVPPMVSAVKVEGRRLHELARKGVEVDRTPRPVTVHELEVGPPIGPGRFPIEVTCSSGTYVRALAADLGTLLGGGAHLAELRRTAIGDFTADQGVAIESLGPEHVLSPADAMRHLRSVTIEGDLVTAVGHGKALALEALGATGLGPWAVLSTDGDLLAVYEPHRTGTAKPSVVLAPAPQP